MKKTLNINAVRATLTEKGLTQKDLAKSVGVAPQAITNWMKEKDFPRPAALLKLATTLQLTFKELVQTSDEDSPVVAFRKKAGAKTTDKHIAKADSIGKLLKPLVPYLRELKALRTLITSPSTEYNKIQAAASQTRERLGIGELAVLEYEHLIGEFKDSGAILVPVLWGKLGNHENALHIRLPKEDVTFIFLNLETRLEDFKFWMAHELAHVYTPSLCGTIKGEDYADALAGALLFPKQCAENAYQEISQTRSSSEATILQRYAAGHHISLNTVYQQINSYAKSKTLPPLKTEEKTIHALRNTFCGPLVSEVLFDPVPPEPKLYISACEHTFQSDFFNALKRMINDNGTGASYVQQVLDASMQDAYAIHEELSH